jgi:capsular polysaccharide biosynthesis protein
MSVSLSKEKDDGESGLPYEPLEFVVTENGHPPNGGNSYVGRSSVVPAPLHPVSAGHHERAAGTVFRSAVGDGLLRIIAKRWLLIVLVAVACIAGSVAYVFMVPPSYDAAAQILVTPVGEDPALQGLKLIVAGGEPARSVQTAVALLDTHAAADRTAQKLGGAWTAASVADVVTVEPRGQSYIVNVQAKAGSPAEAALIANTFAENALELRNEDVKAQAGRLARALRASVPVAPAGADTTSTSTIPAQIARLEVLADTGDPSLSLAEPAQAPSTPTGLPPVLVIVLAGLFGLVLGVAVASAWHAIRRQGLQSRRVVDLGEDLDASG